MGPIESEYTAVATASDIDTTAGPPFASPFHLVSACYTRVTAGAINITLSAMVGAQEFVLDTVIGSTATYYVFPNTRVPHPVALPKGSRIRFKTSGVAGAELRAVMIQWAQGS